MKYSLYKLRSKAGKQLDKPHKTAIVTLDIDKDGMAWAFEDRNLAAQLRVNRVEAHAAGLYLYGLEPLRDQDWRYQEWYLAYIS